MVKLSASILSADLARLADQVKLVRDHADVIHVDVMDAHFASPVTIGPLVVAALRPHTDLPLHGHLMVDGPEGLFDELAQAGMDVVSFHVEAVVDPAPAIAKARGAGMGVGLALGPETPVDAVLAYLEDVDDVLVTARHPSRGGPAVLDAALPNVEAVRGALARRGLSADVEAEGGVTLDAARRCVEAGASVVVAGSAIFGAEDVTVATRDLKAALEAA